MARDKNINLFLMDGNPTGAGGKTKNDITFKELEIKRHISKIC